MKKTSKLTVLRLSFYTLLMLLLIGCNKEREIYTPTSKIIYPEYISPPLKKTELNFQKISLGKQLFFDKNLSSSHKVSCGTCHLPKLAFSDNTSLSPKGVSKTFLKRNTPPLFNLAWHKNYFWDGGVTNLRSQVIAPLTAHDEMNGDIDSIENYLSSNTFYKKAFKATYNESPSVSKAIDAIAEFEFSITSFNSKYDEFKSGTQKLNNSEKNGLLIFQKKCSYCHKEGLFSDYAYHNNGLDKDLIFSSNEDAKRGRNRITLLPSDIQKYKTPSLRNINLTAPYMHDGRYETLNEVINHYSENIKLSKTLSDNIPKEGFQFTSTEKEELISFLKTLTDKKSFTQ